MNLRTLPIFIVCLALSTSCSSDGDKKKKKKKSSGSDTEQPAEQAAGTTQADPSQTAKPRPSVPSGGGGSTGGAPSATSNAVQVSLTGLQGEGFSLLLNGSQSLDLNADGSFSFPGTLSVGDAFSVSIENAPNFPKQECELTGESGVVGASSAPNVSVSCNIIKPTQITSGFGHTCALFENGAVRCFGDSEFGQTGYGTTDTIGDNENPWSFGDVELGQKATFIDAGHYHTCAILEDKSLSCWGQNSSGQLGLGNTDNIGDDETPLIAGKVSMAADEEVLYVSGGQNATCVVTDANNVKCWGEGASGRLGYENETDKGKIDTPADFGTIDLGGATIVSVDVGDLSSMALTDDGTVLGWGVNWAGRLGRTHGNDHTGDEGGEMPPTASSMGIAIKQLSHGGSGTCVIDINDKAKCWGYGRRGKHGHATTSDVARNNFPSDVGLIDVGGDVLASYAFFEHSCVIRTDNKVLCFGENNYGLLGLGNETDTNTQTPAEQGVISLSEGAVQLSAGRYFTCALLESGKIQCWGRGSSGRLGILPHVGQSERVDSLAAVSIDDSLAVTSLHLGDTTSCAILSNDSMKCWGQGSSGRLGLSSTSHVAETAGTEPSTQSAISLGFSVKTAFGGNNTCAVSTTDSLLCFGEGSHGIIGNGSTSDLGDDELPSTGSSISFGSTCGRW